MTKPPGPLVLIEWVDAAGSTGWTTRELSDEPPLVMESVGWLAVDGKNVKILVQSYTEGSDKLEQIASHCGEIVIPVQCVRAIRPLRLRSSRDEGKVDVG